MRLVWAQYALEDRRAIYDHIEADDARAAALVDTRIAEAVIRLIDFPESGRPGRAEGTRELVVPGLPYILPYRLRGDRVEILRVMHAARRWPKRLGASDVPQ